MTNEMEAMSNETNRGNIRNLCRHSETHQINLEVENVK